MTNNPHLQNNGWHVIKVYFPPAEKEEREEARMTIGRFKDGQYHVMGWTPDKMRPYISEAEEASGDEGVVTLPKGKVTLSELVQGDVFTFGSKNRTREPSKAEFIRFY